MKSQRNGQFIIPISIALVIFVTGCAEDDEISYDESNLEIGTNYPATNDYTVVAWGSMWELDDEYSEDILPAGGDFLVTVWKTNCMYQRLPS